MWNAKKQVYIFVLIKIHRPTKQNSKAANAKLEEKKQLKNSKINKMLRFDVVVVVIVFVVVFNIKNSININLGLGLVA